MSPVTSRRFLVKAFDYEEWAIVVEATDRKDAIDPPYLVNYRARDGQTITNDNNAEWLEPAFGEMYRILKPGSFCLSFSGWNKVDLFHVFLPSEIIGNGSE